MEVGEMELKSTDICSARQPLAFAIEKCTRKKKDEWVHTKTGG
jgi:hypothetical protein